MSRKSPPRPIPLSELPPPPDNFRDQLGPEDGDWASVPLGEHGQRLLMIRQSGQALLFLNRCPHAGHALELISGEIWNANRTKLVCSSHHARFRLEDGKCVSGPCKGDYLRRVSED